MHFRQNVDRFFAQASICLKRDTSKPHDDIITWQRFPHHWLFCGESTCYRWIHCNDGGDGPVSSQICLVCNCTVYVVPNTIDLCHLSHCLSYCDLNNTAVILQTTFSNAFPFIKIVRLSNHNVRESSWLVSIGDKKIENGKQLFCCGIHIHWYHAHLGGELCRWKPSKSQLRGCWFRLQT